MSQNSICATLSRQLERVFDRLKNQGITATNISFTVKDTANPEIYEEAVFWVKPSKDTAETSLVYDYTVAIHSANPDVYTGCCGEREK